MKKYLSLFFFLAALIITGCSDPCEGVICGPGTCDDGKCICPEGYEGDFCEILEREKYFGLYELKNSDCGSGVMLNSFSFVVAANAGGGPLDVTISMTGSIEDNFEGTIRSGKLDAASVSSDSNTLIGEFEDEDSFIGILSGPGGVFSCTIAMSK